MARENNPGESGNIGTRLTRSRSRVHGDSSGPRPETTGLQIAAVDDSEMTTPADFAIEDGGRPVENDPARRIEQLERELLAVRAELKSSLERYHASSEEFTTANEEITSVNEELQSTNEELKTSQEELRLVNAKLLGLNNQLAAKIKELETQHADLKNLVAATDVATICLDRDFQIRWFTPAAGRVIRLTEHDCGRPLTDFSHDFAVEDLLEISRKV